MRERVERRRTAVFLDRDGVLNEVVMRAGGRVVGSPRTRAEFELVEGVAEALTELRRAGHHLFVVTNQPDLARGLLEPEVIEAINTELVEGLGIDEVMVCPHDDPDQCRCRKPEPGMLEELARRWEIDLGESFLIGDSWRDLGAGQAAGCRSILLRRPYNEGVEAEYEADSLAAAVELIVSGGLGDG